MVYAFKRWCMYCMCMCYKYWVWDGVDYVSTVEDNSNTYMELVLYWSFLPMKLRILSTFRDNIMYMNDRHTVFPIYHTVLIVLAYWRLGRLMKLISVTVGVAGMHESGIVCPCLCVRSLAKVHTWDVRVAVLVFHGEARCRWSVGVRWGDG